nr:hypothetical protein [Tanacetum cinerariifolium]
MENTILDLIEICHQKELYCMHDNIDDLIESALKSKLISTNSNSQRLDKKKQEVKNVVEQPAERRTLAPILSTKEPEYSLSMKYEYPNTTPETESDEIIKSGVEELVPILNECEVSSEDKRECNVLVCEDSSTFDVCDDHSDMFSDSNNDDDITSNDDAFEDIEYVEASLPDPEIVSLGEENVVHQEEEEFDLEEIQDIVLCKKLLSINRLIANIESLNKNPTPDCVLNSSASIPIFEESDNSLSDNFSPEFETFSDYTKETRSGNTTTHANNSLPEYDSFCFEIEPDQEKLTSAVMNDIYDDSSNDPLLEEVDLFLAFDNSIPSGIENFAYDSEGDIRFLEELLIDDSIPFPNNESFDFEDDPSFPRPPPEPPDAEFDFKPDAREEILVVMNYNDELIDDERFDPGGEIDVSTNIKDDDYFSFMFVIQIFLPYFIYPEKLEGKRIEEEQAAKAQNRKLPVCYDEDNDKEESNSLKDNNIFEIPSCSAVTPNEPVNSLSKDYVQTIKKSVKTEQYQAQDLKSTSKAGSTGIFLQQSANEAKMSKDRKIK